MVVLGSVGGTPVFSGWFLDESRGKAVLGVMVNVNVCGLDWWNAGVGEGSGFLNEKRSFCRFMRPNRLFRGLSWCRMWCRSSINAVFVAILCDLDRLRKPLEFVCVTQRVAVTGVVWFCGGKRGMGPLFGRNL